ncbi:hypothetical protein D9M69_628540 [compost metagenome]
MPTSAVELDVEHVDAGQHGTRSIGDGALGRLCADVLAQYDIDLGIVQNAGLDHCQRAAGVFGAGADLFGWLEQEDHRAGQILSHGRKGLSRAQQHGYVCVVAADMRHRNFLATPQSLGR